METWHIKYSPDITEEVYNSLLAKLEAMGYEGYIHADIEHTYSSFKNRGYIGSRYEKKWCIDNHTNCMKSEKFITDFISKTTTMQQQYNVGDWLYTSQYGVGVFQLYRLEPGRWYNQHNGWIEDESLIRKARPEEIPGYVAPKRLEEQWVVGGYVKLLTDYHGWKKGEYAKIIRPKTQGYVSIEDKPGYEDTKVYTPDNSGHAAECVWHGMTAPVVAEEDPMEEILREAKRRYPTGTMFKAPTGIEKSVKATGEYRALTDGGNKRVDNIGGPSYVYWEGKWSEIVEEKTQKEFLLEEADRRYPIGTRYMGISKYGIEEEVATKKANWYGDGNIEVGRKYVYYNGQWAEIMKEKSPIELILEEAKRRFPIGSKFINKAGGTPNSVYEVISVQITGSGIGIDNKGGDGILYYNEVWSEPYVEEKKEQVANPILYAMEHYPVGTIYESPSSGKTRTIKGPFRLTSQGGVVSGGSDVYFKGEWGRIVGKEETGEEPIRTWEMQANQSLYSEFFPKTPKESYKGVEELPEAIIVKKRKINKKILVY